MFFYFFLISFFLDFQIFQETLLWKLSKFPETFLETSENCLKVFNPSYMYVIMGQVFCDIYKTYENNMKSYRLMWLSVRLLGWCLVLV